MYCNKPNHLVLSQGCLGLSINTVNCIHFRYYSPIYTYAVLNNDTVCRKERTHMSTHQYAPTQSLRNLKTTRRIKHTGAQMHIGARAVLIYVLRAEINTRV